MLRLLRRCAIALAAVVPCVFAFGASAASSEVGLQNVNLACTDGTNLNVALDATSLTSLTNAVTAITLFPAGDPALGCSLSQSTPTSSSGDPNGPKDFAVGGGKYMSSICGLVNFSLSAHVANDAPVVPGQPGVGGTYNNSTGATSPCGEGSFTAKVDCVQVTGNQAMLTAQEQQAKGTPFFGAPGDEVALAVKDNSPDELTIQGGFFTSAPCDFNSAQFFTTPITQGNINVHDG
jgi:hypothetical protein